MRLGIISDIHEHADQRLLDLRAFVTEFPCPLGEISTDPELIELLSLDAAAKLHSSDEVRLHVRHLLREHGFKPTGRNKPASEYLIKASSEGILCPINLAVDVCNVVSLHSGLPISVVDLDRVQEPLHVRVAPSGSDYVFNQSGQVISLNGLLCLFDAQGPCANAIKDSQRTKTSPNTLRTLSLIWGTNQLPGRAAEAESWYQDLLSSRGADVRAVVISILDS
jgi:DNA/RNA-binding domain of Phe-tRNA-synthetase-like protein